MGAALANTELWCADKASPNSFDPTWDPMPLGRALPGAKTGSVRALLSLAGRKDVVDIFVGGQSDLVQGACLNALDDFLMGEVENRVQNLRALLLVRLAHGEEHAGAVLNVAGRK